MDSQITYLKAVLLWLIWQLICTRMVQNITSKVKKPILIAVTPDVLDIKLLHYLSTIQPCSVYLRLATMEVKNEFTFEIIVFLELFNEILSDIKGRDYKFNPRAITVDENGANYCAIQKVFGLDFVTSKVVSCQMHYKNDVNMVSFRIGPSYRDLFKSICHGMCSIATRADYNEKKKWLDEIPNIFSDISQWLTLWGARKYHIFPALRCFGYSNVTLAKSGNSMLKHCMQLWILEAAHNDTSTMLTESPKFNSFLTQVTSSSGKGPY